MSTKRYDLEFKKTIVQLYEQGESVPSLSKEYQVSETAIYKWKDKYGTKGAIGVSKADHGALQKELLREKEKNEILKKALSIFAQK